jgi:hypothetical protein
MVDEALDMQKKILEWEHPPFKVSHSAGEFLYGKIPRRAQPLRRATMSFPSSVAFSPPAEPIKDFDGSDYVDLCPQNSTPINGFLRKVFLPHFKYNAEDGRITAYLQNNHGFPPILVGMLIWE